MTLRMLDSINVANLPPGADAYLGYTGGNWPTYSAAVARFPGKPVLSMAVFASDDAEGCDCEAGDLGIAQVEPWVKRQQARGIARPVVYASVSSMTAIYGWLSDAGLARDVRLLSAHYGAGKHICGPSTCAYPGVPACDGTQWTDSAPGTGGAHIDESVLHDDFFTEAPVAITDDDAAKIARAVWNTDGILPNPLNPSSTTNPSWTANRMLATVTGQVLGEPGVTVAGVLKGLDPENLAAAIATHLGPDVGKQVVTALQKQLAAPVTS